MTSNDPKMRFILDGNGLKMVKCMNWWRNQTKLKVWMLKTRMIILPPCFNPCTMFSVISVRRPSHWGYSMKKIHTDQCAADQSDLTSALLLRFGWKACGRGYLRILILSKEKRRIKPNETTREFKFWIAWRGLINRRMYWWSNRCQIRKLQVNSYFIGHLSHQKLQNYINVFSCKLTSEDKKFLGRSVTKRGASPHDLAALSPPTTSVPNTAHRTRTWSTR